MIKSGSFSKQGNRIHRSKSHHIFINQLRKLFTLVLLGLSLMKLSPKNFSSTSMAISWYLILNHIRISQSSRKNTSNIIGSLLRQTMLQVVKSSRIYSSVALYICLLSAQGCLYLVVPPINKKPT